MKYMVDKKIYDTLQEALDEATLITGAPKTTYNYEYVQDMLNRVGSCIVSNGFKRTVIYNRSDLQ